MSCQTRMIAVPAIVATLVTTACVEAEAPPACLPNPTLRCVTERAVAALDEIALLPGGAVGAAVRGGPDRRGAKEARRHHPRRRHDSAGAPAGDVIRPD